MPIYKIIFEDNSTFFGGESIHCSRWKEIPDLPIVRLEFFVNEGEGIILEGFESYFFMVEAGIDFSKKIGNCPKCGKQGKISKRFIKFNNGQVKKYFVARCKDMGTISKASIENIGEDWKIFVDKIFKNKLGIVKDNNVWLTYNEKQLESINRLFSVNCKKLIKQAFDSRCGWLGKINELVYPISKGDGDKYIYVMGRKEGYLYECKKCKNRFINKPNKECNCGNKEFEYIEGKIVTSYRITLEGKLGKDRYQTGDITKRVIPFGKEDNGRPTNPNFWRRGINK